MYKLSKMQSGFDTYPDVIDGDVAFEGVLDTCNPGLNADGDVVADVNTKLGEVPLCAFIWKKCTSISDRYGLQHACEYKLCMYFGICKLCKPVYKEFSDNKVPGYTCTNEILSYDPANFALTFVIFPQDLRRAGAGN